MILNRALSRFRRDESGASAAEFAMVVPVLLLFLVGTLDVGLYSWSINQAEKAVQAGTRYAVATDMVPSGLATYSFAVDGGIPQGTVVPASAFPGVTCTNTSCSCNGSCGFPLTRDADAFANIVGRMRTMKPDIDADDVTIRYEYSGLGFSGDPNGPDVAPIVTISVDGLEYQPLTLAIFGETIDLPSYRYSLTAEDSEGSYSN